MSAHDEPSPPFDPGGFGSDYLTREWSPGREVLFERPLRFGVFTSAPFVLAGYLSGPIVFVMNRGNGDPTGWLEAGVVGFIGIVIGTLAAAAFWDASPRRLRFDWAERTLTVAGWFERKKIPFEDIGGLRLERLKNFGRGSKLVNRYNCELHLLLKTPEAAPRSVLLVETKAFDDAETPYRQSWPLAAALTDALRLPRPLTTSR